MLVSRNSEGDFISYLLIMIRRSAAPAPVRILVVKLLRVRLRQNASGKVIKLRAAGGAYSSK